MFKQVYKALDHTGRNQSSYTLWNDLPMVHGMSLTQCKFHEKI